MLSRSLEVTFKALMSGILSRFSTCWGSLSPWLSKKLKHSKSKSKLPWSRLNATERTRVGYDVLCHLIFAPPWLVNSTTCKQKITQQTATSVLPERSRTLWAPSGLNVQQRAVRELIIGGVTPRQMRRSWSRRRSLRSRLMLLFPAGLLDMDKESTEKDGSWGLLVLQPGPHKSSL